MLSLLEMRQSHNVFSWSYNDKKTYNVTWDGSPKMSCSKAGNLFRERSLRTQPIRNAHPRSSSSGYVITLPLKGNEYRCTTNSSENIAQI